MKNHKTAAVASQLQLHIEAFTLADHFEHLSFIKNNLGIEDYAKDLSAEKMRLFLNCYEASAYMGLNTSDIKVMLVYICSMDYRKALSYYFNRRESIHCPDEQAAFKIRNLNVPPNKRLSSKEYPTVTMMLTRVHFNSRITIHQIILDAMLMILYDQNKDNVKDFYKAVSWYANDVSYTTMLEFILEKNSKIEWKTTWAKKKAFALNFPALNNAAHAMLLKDLN